jgi:hypothetical protein
MIILDLKIMITETNISLDVLNSTLETTEEESVNLTIEFVSSEN